jgi:2-methylisocitrate lyase-like PEP mutase family enzyme
VNPPSQQQAAETFRALHEGEPFLIPNPPDAGAARLLEELGFAALATTSSGFAYTLGRADGEVTLEEIAGHVARISAASSLPLSVDLEHGLGPTTGDVAAAIECVADVGAVGGSIEDYDPEAGALYDISAAVERIAAAREAADAVGFPFTLTGRSEGGFRGDFDLAETITRLDAYAEAGADVLFAPGLPDIEALREICSSVSKPVNAIGRRRFSFPELAEAGAQRVSIGGSLTWSGVDAMVAAAEAMRDSGDFSLLGSGKALREWYSPG